MLTKQCARIESNAQSDYFLEGDGNASGFGHSNPFEPYSLAPDQAPSETKAKSLPITSSISRTITKFGFKRAGKKVQTLQAHRF